MYEAKCLDSLSSTDEFQLLPSQGFDYLWQLPPSPSPSAAISEFVFCFELEAEEIIYKYEHYEMLNCLKPMYRVQVMSHLICLSFNVLYYVAAFNVDIMKAITEPNIATKTIVADENNRNFFASALCLSSRAFSRNSFPTSVNATVFAQISSIRVNLMALSFSCAFNFMNNWRVRSFQR